MKRITKGIAFLLCISMLFGLCPSSVYATGSEAIPEQIEEQLPDQSAEPVEEPISEQQEDVITLDWTPCQYWEDGNLVDNIDSVKASGKGIESVSAIWKTGYEELLKNLYGEEEDFSVYDVSVEGYTEGDPLTLSFEIVPFTDGIDELKLYYISEEDEGPVAEELPIQEVIDDDYYEIVTFETAKTGVFAIGNVQEVEEEEPQTGELIIKELPSKLVYQLGEAFEVSGLEVVCVENGVETTLAEDEYTVTADLSKNGQRTVTVSYGDLAASFDIWVCDPNNPINVGISVKELPTKTEYVVGEAFDSTGLKVVVYYDNGTEQEIGTYILSEADTMTPGVNPVTVTSGKHTTVFYIVVKEPQPEPVETETTVTMEDGSEIKVKIESSAFENVAYKITDVHNYIWVNTLLSEVFDGNYVALDIQPDENFIPGEKTTVTLPLPDYITSPAVYCVTEKDGIVERIMDVTVEDGMVSFVTDHFSVYAVVETGDRVPKPAMVETDVWVPITTNPKNGDQVLILDKNTVGQANALSRDGNNVVNKVVTIQKYDNQVYILDDDVESALKWDVISGLKFRNNNNNNRYLSISNNTSLTTTSSQSSAKSFTYDVQKSTLSYTYTSWWSTYTRYLTYSDDAWTTVSDPATVYLFKKDTMQIPYQLELGVKNETVVAGRYIYGELPELAEKQLTCSGIPYDGTITYSCDENNGILILDEDGKITFTGKEGSTYIKGTYTFTVDGVTYTSTNYLEISVTTPQYAVDILDENGNSIKKTVSIKNVTEGREYNLKAKATRNGVERPEAFVEWESSDVSIATVDENGKVTFTGKEGVVSVTAIYKYADGSSVTDTVKFSVKQDDVTIPSDGTDDFPEYPNEGSIRFDKHATAVGNFSDTGVVQVELSMTGVPYTEGSEIDVVMMLDMSTSMDENNRAANASVAAQEALKILIKNEDGSFNENRVAIYGFNGWYSGNDWDYTDNIEDVYEYFPTGEANSGPNNYNIEKINGMEAYTDASYQSALNDIADYYTNSGDQDTKKTEAGTNYAAALRQCYLTLKNTKDPARKQYVIFMTDGFASTGFAYLDNNNECALYNPDSLGTNGLTGVQTTKIQDKTEYYSTMMKNEGVEIFSVGLQVGQGVTENNTYIDAGKTILRKIAGTSAGNATVSDYDGYAMFVDAGEDASKIVEIFKTITQSIKQAATNVVVTDKIADEYTMIFELPDGHEDDGGHDIDIDLPDGQELYIEVLDYQLNEVTAADGTIVDYVRGDSTSLAKIYLDKDDSGNFYAASDSTGKAYASPEFEKIEDSEIKKYWKSSSVDDYDVEVDGQYYKFMPKGDGTHNMKKGAYASGTENGNLKIASPYFFYDASTRILAWTAEKLSETELALSYFLYLDESAGCEGEAHQRLPGTYETNDYATLNYTNHLGNNCEQEFPIPQMTWNGAQVSYVFYLVNDKGQPVNRAGRVVPFSEAVYITDVFTESIVWNELDKTDRLIADVLADELVPDIYTLYDAGAVYTIHVFEDEEGVNLNNHFKIESSGSVDNHNTTYVFNTKSDAVKYTVPGIYARGDRFLCKDYNVTKNGETYTYNGNSQIQYEKDGKPIYGTEVIDGQEKHYTIVYENSDKEVEDSFDFANTTVAFAVKWVPELKPDTVVIDYGLDTVIDVAYNDGVLGTVVGVRTDQHSPGLDGDSSTCEATKYQTADVYLNNINGDNFKIGTATVENNTSVRFSLDKENGMQMKDWARFYYEYTMTYFNADGELEDQDMYTSVTVIPATTIYYEDEYVTLSDNWTTPSQTVTKIQQVDRPGPDKVAALYDADNLYGSDAAYLQCSTTSMDSSAMIHVGAGVTGTAEFEFYGTGFDIISSTSHRTGTIVVQVTDAANKTKNYVVDTYYGYQFIEEPTEDYNHDGKIDKNDQWILIDDDQKGQDNSLWQIPVMKITGLDYGYYKVKITISYSEFFDHDQYGGSGYDFYLDAIRIYDPAGRDDVNDVIKDAYTSDQEYLPNYYELRNMVIGVSTFGELNETDKITGIVFIDGKEEVTTEEISDYISYGPNNELYLAPGQSVVFDLYAQPETGYAVDMVQLAWKSVGGTAKAKIWNPAKINASSAEEISVKTATDMYFDITDLDGGTVVIQNTGEEGDSVLSITNIKVTAKEGTSANAEMAMFSISRASVQQAMLSLNNEIVEPESPEKEEIKPTPEPPKDEETEPAPEPPKDEETKPVPKPPKKEEAKPKPPKTEEAKPEPPKAEETKPVLKPPKNEEAKKEPTKTEVAKAESPKKAEAKPKPLKKAETAPKPSESKNDNQVSDDFENQGFETVKPKENKEKGIIGKLIEFIGLLVHSTINWFQSWF